MTRDEALQLLGLEGEPSEREILDAVASFEEEHRYASTPEQQQTLNELRAQVAVAKSLLIRSLPVFEAAPKSDSVAATPPTAHASGPLTREGALRLLELSGEPTKSDIIAAAARLGEADPSVALAKSILLGSLPLVDEPAAAIGPAPPVAETPPPEPVVPVRVPKRRRGLLVAIAVLATIAAGSQVWPRPPGMYLRVGGWAGQCLKPFLVREVPGDLVLGNVPGACLERNMWWGARIELLDIGNGCGCH